MPAYSPSFEMPDRMAHSTRGFSLVELLAVLALIVILVGFTLGLTTGVFTRKAETRAQSDLALISQALERYRAQAGDYPWVGDPPIQGNQPNAEGSRALVRALLGFRSVDPARPQLRVQGNFLPVENLDFGDQQPAPDADPGSAYPLDPWGNPYVYLYNPTYPKADSRWVYPGFLLYSAGPDGQIVLPGDVEQTGIVDISAYEANPVNLDNLVAP